MCGSMGEKDALFAPHFDASINFLQLNAQVFNLQVSYKPPGSYVLRNSTPFFSSKLIQAANAWLRNNPNMAVVKCETTERKLQKFVQNETQFIQIQTSNAAPTQASPSKTPQGSNPGRRSKTQTLTYDIDSMLKHEAPGGAGSFIKGLR